MPSTRPISEPEAEALARGICFKNGPPRRIGVELEWLVHDAFDSTRPVAPSRLAAAVAELRSVPLRSSLTQEPGGQIELSSPPAASLTECVETMTCDLAAVRERLGHHGLRLAGYGLDPWHPPRRILELPRYAAMEEFFDRGGPFGRSMMCSSASVQVCLDAGVEGPGPGGYLARWRLAHMLGPVLVAAFANSPLSQGRPTGLRSSRQGVWTAMDPGRTLAPHQTTDPRDAWARYALDADVLLVRRDGDCWHAPRGLTFRRWLRTGLPRPATADDLAYHLTTLFPPVRPRGHIEFRMIDAQPGDDGWIVPLAVTAALLDDPVAATAAHRAVLALGGPPAPPAPRNPLWRRAARHGLADPAIHQAALACFAAAQQALPRLDASPAIRTAVDEFYALRLARGRCPADDLLDAVTAEPGAGARNAHLIGKDGRS
ncbi:ergothioneine biosynthesis glutamate--cysteine ligase EgtA [Streptomyces sp. RB6PN25]|uniref:Glutamate--cysteine ligase EgtA n=1 Tax=Streptomyces humicola TaxID=2953240 RepID=A0ABT1PZD4_9ACTN|nr:ergothioneine biosynthesis glutamate--cysteine ligase EgtA [Streptomyces humicola]MCQ4083040.1 ergothioneine biosynthesis glutamate--cysteine ligase EgtA [Streptomyces humicola]